MIEGRRSLPVAGYTLTKVVALNQSYSLVSVEDAEEVDEGTTSYGWDWRPVGQRSFIVFLSIVVHPSKTRPEKTEVSLIGQFELDTDEPGIALQPFVMEVAPTLLFPYVREIVSSLTGRGASGPVFIPPFNVATVITTDHAFENSSGTQLLENDKELAQAFRFPKSLASPKKPQSRKRKAAE